MAYQLEDEENQDQKNGNNQDSNKSLGAESGIIQGPQQPSTAPQQGSGQYTNLQSYLDANKDHGFGGQFAAQVGKSVDSANSAQGQASDTFKSASDSGTVKEDQNIINQAVNTPESVVSNQDALKQFRAQQSAAYSGPDQFSGSSYYQPAATATQKAVDETTQAQTLPGQQALLDQYYGSGAGNNNYTGGQKNLDQILIGMDPATRDALLKQQQAAQGSQGNFSTLEGALNSYASGNKATTAQTASDVANAFATPVSQFQKGVQDRTSGVLSQRDAEIAKINAAFTNRNVSSLTPEERVSIGVTPGEALYGVGTSSPFGPVATANNDVNMQNLATPEEIARSHAYATLQNQPDNFLTGQSENLPLYTGAKDSIANAIQQRMGALNLDLQNQQYRYEIPGNDISYDSDSGNQRQYGTTSLADAPQVLAALQASVADQSKNNPYYGHANQSGIAYQNLQNALDQIEKEKTAYGSHDYAT